VERRPLGGTGVEVSRIVLGCGNFGGIGSAPELFGLVLAGAAGLRVGHALVAPGRLTRLAALRAAGMMLAPSNAAAVRLAASLVGRKGSA